MPCSCRVRVAVLAWLCRFIPTRSTLSALWRFLINLPPSAHRWTQKWMERKRGIDQISGDPDTTTNAPGPTSSTDPDCVGSIAHIATTYPNKNRLKVCTRGQDPDQISGLSDPHTSDAEHTPPNCWRSNTASASDTSTLVSPDQDTASLDNGSKSSPRSSPTKYSGQLFPVMEIDRYRQINMPVFFLSAVFSKIQS